MNSKFNFKKILPEGIAIIIFLVITFLFFSPLFEGKQLKQQDITHHKGMSKEIVDYRNTHDGQEPLWTNSMFGGMPAYQISVYYGSNLLQYIDHYLFRLSLPRPADYFFLYMLGFFILLRVLKVDPWLSIIGAIAFAFSSYFLIILEAGHNSKAHAIGYMAPTLAFILLTYRKKYLVGGILTALFMGLELYANHPQITYYLGLIVLILGVTEFIKSLKEKELLHFFKASGVLLAALGLALSTNIGSLWTTMEYSPYTIRGAAELTFDQHDKSTTGLDKSYATQWSYGKGESFSLMIPNIKGGGSGYLGQHPELLKDVRNEYRQTVAGQNSYWGDQPFTSGPVYIGAILVFLFVLGIFFVKGDIKWILLIATLLALFLSWGKNMMWLTDLFLDYFPAYNKFRAVSMILVIAELTMALLGILALKEIFSKPQIIKEQKVKFLISLGITAGLSLLFYLMPESFFSFFSQAELSQQQDILANNPSMALQYQEIFDNIKSVRIELMKGDAIRSAIFILLAGGALWMLNFKKIPQKAIIAVLGILLLLDIIPVDRRYINKDNYERKKKVQVPYYPTQADLMILQDTDPNYRVFNLTVSPFQDASTSYFHKSIGGYHGAKFRRYQDLIDYHLGRGNQEVMNMLNTKYFIQKGQDGKPTAQPNYAANGNAWFVKDLVWAKNANAEISYLGNLIQIQALNPQQNFQIYGRGLKAVDTMMQSVDIIIPNAIEGQESTTISLAQYNLQEGIEYTVGKENTDSLENFIPIDSKINLQGKLFKIKLISRFNSKQMAVINSKDKSAIEGSSVEYDPNAKVTLKAYEPNNLIYESNSTKDGFVVFSEIYYAKGWKAYIDNKEVPHYRVDYVLRGMLVPAGKHEIIFKFHPNSYYTGKIISLIGSLLILLALAFLGYRFITTKKDEVQNIQA